MVDRTHSPTQEGEVLSEQLKNDISRVVRQEITEFHAGPIPSAAELEKLAAIDESFPDRMLKMAEKQQAHEHALENREIIMVEANLKASKEQLTLFHKFRSDGQVYAIVTVGILSSASVALAAFGAIVPSGILAGTVGLVAGVLITGKLIKTRTHPSDGDNKTEES